MEKLLITAFVFLAGLPFNAIPEWVIPPEVKIPEKELRCMTEALYFEARDQSEAGILAVGKVILNRKDSSRYPDTVCKVINQQLVKGVYQFSYKIGRAHV